MPLWKTDIQCTSRHLAKLCQSEQTNDGQRPDTVTDPAERVAQGDPEAGYKRRRHRRTPQSFSFVFLHNDVEIQTSLHKRTTKGAGSPTAPGPSRGYIAFGGHRLPRYTPGRSMPRPRTGRGRREPRSLRLEYYTARPQPPHSQDTAHHHSHMTPITARGQPGSLPAQKTRRTPLSNPTTYGPGRDEEPRNQAATHGYTAAYRTDTTPPHRVKRPGATDRDPHEDAVGEADAGSPC